jgi:hypothetical protein
MLLLVHTAFIEVLVARLIQQLWHLSKEGLHYKLLNLKVFNLALARVNKLNSAQVFNKILLGKIHLFAQYLVSQSSSL